MEYRAKGFAAALTLALWLDGCSGPSSSTPLAPSTSPSTSANAPAGVFGSFSTQPLTVGQTRAISPAEPGYAGSYTVTSSSPATISVSPASGAGPFVLTGSAIGASTITIADQAGNQGSFTLSVVAASASPTPGAGSGGSATPTPVGATPTPTPSSQISVTPADLTLDLGSLANATVSLPPGDGSLANVSASVGNSAVAAAANLGNGSFSIVANGPGSTPIVFTDGNGHQTTLQVNVPSSPIPRIQLSPSLLNLHLGVAGLNASAVTVSEPGYNGPFTATSSNNDIAIAAPIPLTNQYLITAVGTGTDILTFADNQGRVVNLGVNVL